MDHYEINALSGFAGSTVGNLDTTKGAIKSRDLLLAIPNEPSAMQCTFVKIEKRFVATLHLVSNKNGLERRFDAKSEQDGSTVAEAILTRFL
jgi:hypothetical protein